MVDARPAILIGSPGAPPMSFERGSCVPQHETEMASAADGPGTELQRAEATLSRGDKMRHSSELCKGR
jgi:hypothetical protein